MIMRQIYIGSVQRSNLNKTIKKDLRIVHLYTTITIIIVALTLFLFHDVLFNKANGRMSNIVLVSSSEGTGSAVYVGNNYLLTAAHVVCDMSLNSTCLVEFQNPNDPEGVTIETEAELMAIGKYFPGPNPEEDYALLRLKNLNGDRLAKACEIGSGSNVKVGDKATIIGYPGGTYSYTEGSISNISGGVTEMKELYVADAKAWHGNSGGALLKEDKLIGIVIMGGTLKGYNDGQAYALKIDKVKKTLNAKGFQF